MLLLLYLFVFLGALLTFPFFEKCYLNQKKGINTYHLDIYSSAFMYFWLLLGMTGVAFLIPDLVPYYFFLALLSLLLAVFYLVSHPLSKIAQNLFEYFLCLAGAYVLSNGNSMMMVVLTSFFWLFAWRVFRSFDQFPFISLLMTVLWMLSFLIVGQIVVLPKVLMVLAGFVGLIVFAIFKRRLKYSCVNLGVSTSAFVGYMCAGFWGYFFLKGYISTAICAYSYYLFEILIMMWAAFHGKAQMPLFIQSLNNKERGAKTIKVLFWDVLLIALLSVFVVVFKNGAGSFLVCSTALVLYYIYLQLSHISKPIPGYREIFADLKQGIKDVYTQSKATMAQTGVEKIKKAPQKKKAPVKKKQKSKGKKKK